MRPSSSRPPGRCSWPTRLGTTSSSGSPATRATASTRTSGAGSSRTVTVRSGRRCRHRRTTSSSRGRSRRPRWRRWWRRSPARTFPASEGRGPARVVSADDRELALGWWIDFSEEVLHQGGPGRDRAEATLDHRLSSPNAGILLWEDGGQPVSLAGWGGPTPNGIRVGPVYTRPELRGRGHATALTAELSQRLLDGRVFAGGGR